MTTPPGPQRPPVSVLPITIPPNDSPTAHEELPATELEDLKRVAEQADKSRQAWVDLAKAFSERSNEAAKTGQMFGLIPALVMLAVGAGMIAAALSDTVAADPGAITAGNQVVVMTGTALTTPEFIAVVLIGAILLLAAPAAVYASGLLARRAVLNEADPKLEEAKKDKENSAEARAEALTLYAKAQAAAKAGPNHV